MTCIIIDDEIKNRESIENILIKYCTDVEVIGQYSNIETSFHAINAHQPDIIFLDIQMPGGNGLELLSYFTDLQSKVIITTAYKEYAIEAIKLSAADYLLKPISIKELITAVEKVKTSILKNNVVQSTNKYLFVHTKAAIEPVPVEDIVYCEAESNYTNVYLINGAKKLISKPIKEIEDQLSSKLFFRIHHSYLVQKKHIKQYIKGDGGTVITILGSEIDVSRRNKNEFLDWFTT